MILSSIAGAPRIRASRSDYIRDFLTGQDLDTLVSDAGEPVYAVAALRVAVVYRCINVIAHAIAGVPLVLYERLEGGARRAATEQPTYRLVHDRPNAWMTSFRWRHLLATRAVLYGDSYNELLPGPGGISQIVPLEPTTTRVVDQLTNGKLLYVTRDLTANGYGPERRLVQDQVAHVRGLSLDGKAGIPLMDVAKNAIGLALSAEKHGSMFLKNGARFLGFLSTPGNLENDARERSEAAWSRSLGARNSGTVPLLEGGIDFKQISANNRDSQWQEARGFQVEELLRFLGVPGVLAGYPDKTATYASAEQFFQSFVKDTVRPWTENIAAELNFSVVIDPERFFVEFDLDGLLKGDIRTRYEAHQKAIMSGWKNRNEVRREENYDPGPPALDEFLEPTNMAEAGTQDNAQQTDPAGPRRSPGERRPTLPLPPHGEEDPALAHTQFVVDAAARVVRREAAAIRGGSGRLGAAVRYAKDPEGWAGWLGKFYEEHAAHVAEVMHLDPAQAQRYVSAQRESLLASGVGIMTEDWERERTWMLAFMALGEEF